MTKKQFNKEVSNFKRKLSAEGVLPPNHEKEDTLFCFSRILEENRKYIPKLYRYCRTESIESLEKEELYLSTMNMMNDIFEGDIINVIQHQRNCQVVEFASETYLKSFSEKKNDILMFAHYANSFKGICVEYDFSCGPEAVLKYLFPVAYAQNPFESISDVISRNSKYFYLRKAKDWAHEKEWRFLMTKDEAKELGINDNKINLFHCIKAVYLGVRVNENDKKDIVKRLSPYTAVYETKMCEGKYAIEVIGEENNYGPPDFR